MKKRLCIVCYLTLGSISGVNNLAESERTHLSAEMLRNPEYSDQYVLSLIESGINASNLEARQNVIQSIGIYAESLLHDNPDNSIYLRPINSVPNLRDYLITYYNAKNSKDDHGILDDVVKTISELPFIESKSETELELIDRLEKLESNPKKLDELIAEMVPVQIRIPLILCTFWPKDREIHDFIWSYIDAQPMKSAVGKLILLNTGRFTTKRANDFRISQLTAYPPVTERYEEIEAISLAAKGLSLSHPESAIPYLFDAAFDHYQPREDIIITISGYSDDQLEPFYSRLVSLTLGPRGDLSQSDELDRAYERLVPYAKNKNYIKYDDEDRVDVEPVEGFELTPVMIWDASVSDQEIWDMITRGIESDNREAVRMVLQSLGFYFSDFQKYYVVGQIARRDFRRVPGLKEFLISKFQNEYKKSEFDLARAQLNSLFAVTQSNPQYEYQRELIRRFINANNDLDERYRVTQEAISPWTRIPKILCSVWPGDVDVRNLLWMVHDNDLSDISYIMLDWLDNCRVYTTKATQYRIENLLNHLETSEIEISIENMIKEKAISGLMSTDPNISVPHLIEAGFGHADVRNEIIVLLDDYSKGDLRPYLTNVKELLDLVERPSVREDDVIRAYKNLVDYIATYDSTSQQQD